MKVWPSGPVWGRHGWYALFWAGFALWFGLLWCLERWGWSRDQIGVLFLLSSVGFYAAIGIANRTSDPLEYYVAGRRVPAFYNGMATAADWMSAASFIGLAGTLYLQGYDGLAFVLGWTGGYCLVGLLLAPYLRRFGGFTLPDFLGERYGGAWTRWVGASAAVLCSFTYVVAQLYGVGLITSRLTGLAFELGVFLGLGGVLICSFLGGMRSVTWTQVTQYGVMLVAFVVPVVWLSVQQTGSWWPPSAYVGQLHQVSARERALAQDPQEIEVRRWYQNRADVLQTRLRNPSEALAAERYLTQLWLDDLRHLAAPPEEVAKVEQVLYGLPRDEASAKRVWTQELEEARKRMQPLAGMPPHAQAYAGDPEGSPEQQALFSHSRRNFLALVFCLMVGTASLPHVLARYYTVADVPSARRSVVWTLFFVSVVYLLAPALAVMVKQEVFQQLVGTRLEDLPAWVMAWGRAEGGLLKIRDVNGDGVVQFNEIDLAGDMVMLASPEIAGLPYVVSGLVAAGALAAALSTADGLLLTMANALSHDLYPAHPLTGRLPTTRRVAFSKWVLLVLALLAAYVAALKPGNMLFLVSAAFSLAASAFFPVLVLGIFWKRANACGAVSGMLAGLATTLFYLLQTHWSGGHEWGVGEQSRWWWGIEPMSAGVFGVPVGLVVTVCVSWLTPAPGPQTQAWVERLRGQSP